MLKSSIIFLHISAMQNIAQWKDAKHVRQVHDKSTNLENAFKNVFDTKRQRWSIFRYIIIIYLLCTFSIFILKAKPNKMRLNSLIQRFQN